MEVYRCRICGEVYLGEKKPGSCPFCGAHQEYFVLAKEWKWLRSAVMSDITKENLKKALDLEVNNTNFYKVVSERSKDAYTAGMFKGLSKVENEHASAICRHLKIQKPNSGAGADKAVDSDIENVKEANRREKNAVAFYGQASRQAVEEEMKDFFDALTRIESDHITLTS